MLWTFGLFMLSTLSLLRTTYTFQQRFVKSYPGHRFVHMSSSSSFYPSEVPKPLAIVVSVEIKEDRVAEFLNVIAIDAIGSVDNENGGCLRFDVLRDQTNPCKFTFYEVYKDAEAAARHREYPHFKVWTDFKTSGGVLSQTAVKSDALFYTK
jgi:quinol monooxygenase YgiN